ALDHTPQGAERIKSPNWTIQLRSKRGCIILSSLGPAIVRQEAQSRRCPSRSILPSRHRRRAFPRPVLPEEKEGARFPNHGETEKFLAEPRESSPCPAARGPRP